MLYSKYFFILLSLFLLGCQRDPIPPHPGAPQVCPKLKILKPIPKNLEPKEYKLTFKTKGDYLLVKPEDLSQASAVSQQKTRYIEKQKKYIRYYEKQILIYRNKYCKKGK